ncbi:MAG: hypothetical protein ACR2NY_04125 [Alphaproteobacteria bacterium]
MKRFRHFIKKRTLSLFLGLLFVGILPLATAKAAPNKFFVSLAPALTYSHIFDLGLGGNFTFGIDDGYDSHAASIDYHNMKLGTNQELNDIFDDLGISDLLREVNININTEANFQINVDFVAATYDFTHKLGNGDFRVLIGSGFGGEVYFLNVKGGATTTLDAEPPDGSQTESLSENLQNIDENFVLGGLLLTPRIGFEWHISDLFAFGMNLRGFIDIPAFPLSRGTVDANLKITF